MKTFEEIMGSTVEEAKKMIEEDKVREKTQRERSIAVDRMMKEKGITFRDVVSLNGDLYRLELAKNKDAEFDTLDLKPSPLGNITRTVN
jgi:hypothetical protein